MKVFGLAVAGLLLISGGAKSAPLEKIPLESIEEYLTYATNSVTYVSFGVSMEQDGGMEWEGRFWVQKDSTYYSWDPSESEGLSLGEFVENRFRYWLNARIENMVTDAEINGNGPMNTAFLAGVFCRARTPQGNEFFQFSKNVEYRLTRNGTGYEIPEEVFTHPLESGVLVLKALIGLIVPGIKRVTIEEMTPSGVKFYDSQNQPDVYYDIRLKVLDPDVLYFPYRYVGTRTKGKTVFYYADGTRQSFDLSTGRLIPPLSLRTEVAPSPRDDVKVILTGDETTVGKAVLLEVSTDLKRWEQWYIIPSFSGEAVFSSLVWPAAFFRAAVFESETQARVAALSRASPSPTVNP